MNELLQYQNSRMRELLAWFVNQFEGESGAGANHWEQMPEFNEAKAIVEQIAGMPTDCIVIRKTKPMGITELLAAVGDRNIEFQNLENDQTNGSWKHSEGRIEFRTATDKVKNYLFEDRRYIGLVVWLPVERVPERLRPKKAKKS